ncbi:MAG: hypothetical protein AAGA77_17125 [Bacteroidota bacterium]
MKELIEYEFLSWLQFSMIALIVSLLFFVLSRFHLFSKHAEEKTIGFRMIMYLLTVIVVVSFLLVRPFYNFLFLLVVFGMFYKNIVSYSRALFSLYYSRVKFGDHIKLGDVSGKLMDMNFGGIHILTTENRVYFPFNTWKADSIVLESESGKVLVSFECKDDLHRNDHDSVHELEKSLFNYPFLAVSNVKIDKEADTFMVAVRIADIKYKGGLFNHISKAGFRLKGNII